jgi:probable addiction module antidote protein
MTEKTRRWDPARYLETDQDVAEFIDAVLEDGDPAVVAEAIGVVARARGMSQLARDSGLTREGLYRALNREGNPGFATIMKVLGTLCVRLRATKAA